MEMPPAALVSDRAEWVQEVGRLCRDLRAIPERETWRSASDRPKAGAALVLDLTAPFYPKLELLKKWAKHGWQPLCVLCIKRHRGAADLTAWASRLGYHYTLHGDFLGEYCDDLEAHLASLVEQRIWLVPEVAGHLECFDPEVVDALAAAFRMIPQHTTVHYWTEESGLKRRQELEELFVGHGLGSPKVVLDWLRVARAVEYAESLGRDVTRNELARASGFSSGKYLGERAKALSGKALGELLAIGLDGMLRIMSERLGR